MISRYSALQPLSQAALPRISNGGRAYLPVDPQAALYAHFQYVSGVPAEKTEHGISINKLTILDRLISHLMTIRSEASRDASLKKNTAQFPPDDPQIDRLITHISKTINNSVIQAEDYGYAPSGIPAGIAINTMI